MGLIYLDSCLVIYLVEQHAAWFDRVRAAIANEPDASFAISPLVKAKCLVAPIRNGDLPLERAYSTFLEQFIVLEMNEPVFLDAARLRARFNLKMPDALHLACAQRHDCTSLWTNDARLQAAGAALVRSLC